MKKSIISFLLISILPGLCFGASAKYTSLVREKQRKMAELEKCMGSSKGLKIAGISTLGLTAVGVAGNIAQAGKRNEYDSQIARVDKKINSVNDDITQNRETLAELNKKNNGDQDQTNNTPNGNLSAGGGKAGVVDCNGALTKIDETMRNRLASALEDCAEEDFTNEKKALLVNDYFKLCSQLVANRSDCNVTNVNNLVIFTNYRTDVNNAKCGDKPASVTDRTCDDFDKKLTELETKYNNDFDTLVKDCFSFSDEWECLDNNSKKIKNKNLLNLVNNYEKEAKSLNTSDSACAKEQKEKKIQEKLAIFSGKARNMRVTKNKDVDKKECADSVTQYAIKTWDKRGQPKIDEEYKRKISQESSLYEEYNKKIEKLETFLSDLKKKDVKPDFIGKTVDCGGITYDVTANCKGKTYQKCLPEFYECEKNEAENKIKILKEEYATKLAGKVCI